MKDFLNGVKAGTLLNFIIGKDVIKELHPEQSFSRWFLSKLLLMLWTMICIIWIPVGICISLYEMTKLEEDDLMQKNMDRLDYIANAKMSDESASERDEVLSDIANRIKD